MSADEMFKELGYDKKNEDEEFITYLDSGNEDLYILFDKRYKVVDGYPSYDYFLDMPRLKAVNKKVEELGW